MKKYITTIKKYKCINVENIHSFEEITNNNNGDKINETNFIISIIDNNITLYYNNEFIKGNPELKPEITISRNKSYSQLVNKNTTNFLFPISNKLNMNSGLYCITKSFISLLLNTDTLFYPHVFSYNEYNTIRKQNIFLHEQTVNKNWYNWKTEEEVKNLKLKYFPEDSYIVCICGRIAINSYPKSLLEAIKILRKSGLNIYLLILGEVKISQDRLTPNLYKELKSYDWIKSFTVNKKEILNYFRFCDVLASTYRDFCNHVGGSNKIKEYLLCDKPILCSRGKERENELGKYYSGFYDCKTCDTVPPLCWTKEFLKNPISYVKQYKKYFYTEDKNGGNQNEINDITFILKNMLTKINVNNFCKNGGDILQNINSSKSCIEAYCMFYNSINDNKKKNKIIQQIIKLCCQSVVKYNLPCPYIIKISQQSSIVNNNRNTQHFLWCAKTFYEHFKLTNNIKHNNKAKEIIDYICENNCYKNTKIFINWFNTNNDNKVSIKALTCADMLIIFGKEDYLNANINFYKEKMFNKETSLFSSYYDLDNEKCVKTENTYLHENLELAEGFFNCYELSENKEFYNIAENIVKNCSKLISSNINNLARLQCYYWMKKYNISENIDLVKSEVLKITETYKKENYISPYSNKKIDNIFGHIYLQRIYTYEKLGDIW